MFYFEKPAKDRAAGGWGMTGTADDGDVALDGFAFDREDAALLGAMLRR